MSETLRRGVAGLTTVLAVDFLGAASAAPSIEHVPAPPAIVQEAPAPDPEAQRYNQYLQGPESPCLKPYEPTVQQALACKAMQQHTRIALVNFDYTPEEAQVIASSMVTPFNKSTNGVFNAEPIVVPASPAAKAEAVERNPGCVDEFMDFASVAAQATMPKELAGDKVDMVIALTKARDCNPSVAGKAEGARYADILMGGHEEMSLEQVGFATAHEAGHNVGLGHAGDMVCGTHALEPAVKAGALDLDVYLKDCELWEYGTGLTVMGDPFNIHASRFKAALPQIPPIMWPQETLGEPADLAVEATPKGVSLSYQDAKAGKFITIPLPLNDAAQKFQNLAIVPEVDDATQPGADYAPNIWGGTAYLHAGDNSLAELGYIDSLVPGEYKTRVLQYQGKRIAITLADGRITVVSS